MDSLVYQIWLSLCCTPASPTFLKLTESFDSAEEVYNATEREIRLAIGAKSSDCSRINEKNLDRAKEIYNFCREKQVGLLSYYDDEFPYSLKTIPNPPALLYYRGKLPDFDQGFRCAVVGTRSLSQYGKKNAFKLGYDLACAGAQVVSGMAVGIDSVAMAGAIAGGGTTIAVLGSGINICYPPSHKRLAREIVKKGCVFTEYAPGTRPDGFNFPRRNRIISGLSSATVVVEGSERSGSMITARYAEEQERKVFAFPGNVGNAGSQATNLLIKNGANICTCCEDIIKVFEKEYATELNKFNLKEKLDVNMDSVLRELQVSALTPQDKVFNPTVSKSTESKTTVPPEQEKEILEQKNAEQEQSIIQFDKESLKLYKKIPIDRDCTIDSLVDENENCRTVMKMLLKLEMGKFVVMLPGERVKRNLK